MYSYLYLFPYLVLIILKNMTPLLLLKFLIKFLFPLKNLSPFLDFVEACYVTCYEGYCIDNLISVWSVGANENGMAGKVAPSLRQLRSNQHSLLPLSLSILPPSSSFYRHVFLLLSRTYQLSLLLHLMSHIESFFKLIDPSIPNST